MSQPPLVKDRAGQQLRAVRQLLLAGALGLVCMQAFAADPAPVVQDVAVAPDASSASDQSASVSPYVLAARRHALEVAGNGPSPVVPPSQRRTRQAIGQASLH
jgi:FAD/FMN-containing dehydrogenase